MRTIVAIPYDGVVALNVCPAHLALRMEGIDHEQYLCIGDLDYGDIIAAIWRSGHGFILIEHDVVPWPGALATLEACQYDWCCHLYPYHSDQPAGTRDRLGGSIGCVKFSTRLVKAHPDLCDAWEGVPWRAVDGHMIQAIGPALGQDRGEECAFWHEHLPPVAHARRYETEVAA